MVLAAIAVLACPVRASVLEAATINVGSNFSSCLGPSASTTNGTEAVINCGGEQTVTGFPLPALMSTQAFANATPNAGGVRVIVDLQDAINTGVIGPSSDPTQFNSAVGFTLDAQTQDDVTFSAGAFAVFTWSIHEHIENLSGDGSGSGPFSEHTSFGFTPVLQDSDLIWTCDLTCRDIGDFVPGVGHVVDMTLTRTEQVPLTPGQVIHLFDHMNMNGVVDVRAGPNQENEHVDLDFLDPVTVSAQVFDSQGHVLTNVTATSALGVNYLARVGPATPEAGTLSMLAVGFLALVGSRFISFRQGPRW
ncbi:MAG TPA: hypothetical protein VKB88_46825 [Bryobacteraceae bacterium]|nr:hypothetical protein [Bryobacteraceae bacterium]